MKTALLLTSILFVTACSDLSFTYNGLQCPTNDLNAIEADLASCRIYNLDEVDKALRNDPTCEKCLKAKGYKIAPKELSDMNASK